MKELNKKYDHIIVEKNKNKKWISNNIFVHDQKSKNPKFSLIMPPPNVTGKLHLGHAWDGSIQDFLIRYKKMNGFDTIWIPGMDHAGIATQVKVEQRLKDFGIDKNKLGRDKFIEKVVEWKEEYAETIRRQWHKMGFGIDHTKEAFTFSDELQNTVKHIFVKMYNDKLIYRGHRIVNWDVTQKTAISNIEVIYKEEIGNFYYFKYITEDKKNSLTVATTRPETMFGDVCLVVNPNDKRYKKYIGQKVFNPVNQKLIPVIGDEYVEIDFGTGVMKCTPAHDANDFEIGKKYNFESIICMNEDGTLNEKAGIFSGLDRIDSRSKIIEFTKENKTFVKVEDITHQIGFSERSGAIIEPYLSNQWFVKMDELSKSVLEMQKNSKTKINFFPERFNDTLKTWMKNTYDWTISRQLWWGHRIPAWYHNITNEIYVGLNEPTDIANWHQDPDVLDTWFSSGLWPFAALGYDANLSFEKQSVFFKKYFPIDVMVTGYDIIFFWVARMIFQTYNETKTKPFNKVLIHGLIRDEQGRKMSKSLGNGIDPMNVIEESGADSLRFFLLTNSSPGLDLRFSNEKIKSSWNFINKLWNAARYVFMNVSDIKNIDDKFNNNFKENEIPVTNKWVLNKLSIINIAFKKCIDNFEFTNAGKIIYDFVWDDYCSWFIELSKINLESENAVISDNTKMTLLYVLKNILIMLHPFIPFVTEELYSYFDKGKSILNVKWLNKSFNYDANFIDEVIEITKSIREFRLKYNIKKNNKLCFEINLINSKYNKIINDHKDELNKFLIKTCNSSIFGMYENNFVELLVRDYILKIDISNFVDVEKEKAALEEELDKIRLEIVRSEKMLKNENFIKKASSEKIKDEENKYHEYKIKFEKLLENIKKI